jgi:ferritin
MRSSRNPRIRPTALCGSTSRKRCPPPLITGGDVGQPGRQHPGVQHRHAWIVVPRDDERSTAVLSERFVDALNEQIAREFAAAHQYVGIGAHYAAQTFPQLSAFFYEQADEREHAMKMVTYLLDRDANVHFGAIEEPRSDFPDHVAPIRHALEQEKRVTVQINGLFEIARETRDTRASSSCSGSSRSRSRRRPL